ncbi:hypothetical protein BR93DRAFT_730739 [Coniochaeta sp. PMI_546]|nr:hypothetical protein BR93DRAFT_730739 [Coniochaeta sp. PMI_546]
MPRRIPIYIFTLLLWHANMSRWWHKWLGESAFQMCANIKYNYCLSHNSRSDRTLQFSNLCLPIRSVPSPTMDIILVPSCVTSIPRCRDASRRKAGGRLPAASEVDGPWLGYLDELLRVFSLGVSVSNITGSRIRKFEVSSHRSNSIRRQAYHGRLHDRLAVTPRTIYPVAEQQPSGSNDGMIWFGSLTPPFYYCDTHRTS